MTSEITGDSLRGHLTTMLLSALEAGPAHGFDLLKRLDRAGCGALRLKEGSVYPALYRLERDGLITGEWESGDSQRRGPRRRIYHLTRKGRAELAAGREEWRQFVSVVGAIVGA